MRYSDEDLDMFKALIENKLMIATSELSNLRESILDTNPNAKSFEDSAEQSLKDELTIMAARQERLINELRLALYRIGAKTYGICSVTGELIPKERLMVVPHTTKSMIGKNK